MSLHRNLINKHPPIVDCCSSRIFLCSNEWRGEISFISVIINGSNRNEWNSEITGNNSTALRVVQHVINQPRSRAKDQCGISQNVICSLIYYQSRGRRATNDNRWTCRGVTTIFTNQSSISWSQLMVMLMDRHESMLLQRKVHRRN